MKGKEKIIVGIFAVAIFATALALPSPASADMKIKAVSIMSVNPIDAEVLPGETATYNITVRSISAPSDPQENVTLAVEDPKPGWTYSFDPEEFVINATETKYSILSITVPADAAIGDYYHKINATVYASGYERLGSTSRTAYTGVKTTAIPEFPVMAIPIAIVLAIAFLMFRRREWR